MIPVFLNQFYSVKPKNCLKQSDILSWVIKCHQTAEMKNQTTSQKDIDLIERLFQRFSVKETQISQRYSECDDMSVGSFDNAEIYRINDESQNGVDILQRAKFFSDRAYEVFKKFYNVDLPAPRPNHLIHVTCTGYISPSAAQKIITEKNWGQTTDITHAYHMGCYASLPAVRLAKSLVSSESPHNSQYSTDIVHNEMCGLHMNPLAHTPEQMVVQTLFADGHMKYTASCQRKEVGKNFKIIAVYEKVIPDSQEDMSWTPAPWGMQMNLSREVPVKIKLEIKKFTSELFQKANVKYEDGMKSVFAIHPGGPKIIDSVQEVLELSDSQVSECKKVLYERGNMSSATLPHVWDEILNNNYPSGTKVVSYAFGPGLTLFGSVFEVC